MIAIIDYNAGNATSLSNVLTNMGYECEITADSDKINSAEKVVFPGVGEASSAMKYLKENGLDQVIINLKQPFLGICLGMQLMCKFSEEGATDCLGIFDCNVKLFPALDIVPHNGWNNMESIESQLFAGINNVDDVYFIHSYYAEICEYTISKCDYILPFSAALQKDNFYGTQFHPEKSGLVGQIVLKNFLKLT
ncbi:MAG: imidazole glycerol phosphate synthase subunit HisH [Saprospiraceae bacterium]|nr:imidazole glycerol phosphate synthase subunit HisH [Candidatus Brachybacter algidus]